MEMEFKDNSRRRTLVLVVGVLLALGAGAAAFMLSNQGTDAPSETIPTTDIVVAPLGIGARETITQDRLTLLTVPRDQSNESAITDPTLVANRIAAISILPNQAITENMLATAVGPGQVQILEPDETVAPNSAAYRAVSITVPAERAAGGLIDADERVDIIGTMTFPVTPPVDPETGLVVTDPESGQPVNFTSGYSTKPMWLDVKVLTHELDSDLYVLRMDMQQAEEVALAQVYGAQFSLVLRPEIDTRDLDRSAYGETVDRVLTHYNFPIPENIDGIGYEQPAPFPSPFPAEPYLDLGASPSPSPDELVEIPIDTALESPAPVATLLP